MKKKSIDQTTTCDGSTTTAERTWVKEINLVHQRVGDNGMIAIATGTVTGPLRFQIEREIQRVIVANEKARAAVPRADLRTHVHSF